MTAIYQEPGWLMNNTGRQDLNNFYQAVIQTDTRYRTTRRVDSLDLLEPITKAAVIAILADAEAAGALIMNTCSIVAGGPIVVSSCVITIPTS
jgi:hypothetical protein